MIRLRHFILRNRYLGTSAFGTVRETVLLRNRPGMVLLAVMAMLVCGAIQAQEALRIAAIVNEEVISAYDLGARTAMLLAFSQQADKAETRRRLAPQVLRSLIDEKLKMQEAKRLSIRVGKSDIERAISQLELQNGLPKGGLDAFLSQNGISRSVLIDRIEAGIAWIKVVNRRLRAQISISGEQIDEMLAKIEKNKGKPEMLVAEILLPVDNPEHESEIGLLANRLVQQVKGGAAFTSLAGNFSQSPTAAVGGDLGWIKQGQLGGKLDATLAKLQPGQISNPIRTLAGYHILLLRERRTDPGAGSADITVSLQQLFIPVPKNTDPATQTAQMELAMSMGQKAKNCQDMKKLSEELDSPMSGSLGRVKIDSLPIELRTEVQDLAVDKASRPIRTNDGFIVLMVCEREKDSTDVQRRKVEQLLLDQRRSILARRYLRDLHRAAFVDVRL
ncbi:MAG TPA: peptidyl-prolyl cis-trans isomerase [Rhodospirillaceae bacterium]|nr:peptidyl-prolyl cis-trans isomerase [Rhodospirillaceae bacterium]HIJ91847.1 peptidyl-prolyl cis-trans isomerase [Rhodospirillaceae bacterium]